MLLSFFYINQNYNSSRYINCFNFENKLYVTIFTLPGANISPTNITLSNINNTFAVLSWIPPLNDSYCSFNYIINITNSSSVTDQMYSNSTSLILTGLTHGETYSFAVAVTDSTGQHGPWSEELMVTWDGERANFP